MPHEDIVEQSGGCSTNAPSAGSGSADPLLAVIVAYRSGLADFHQFAPEDDDAANDYADRTYCPPMAAIEQWHAAAQTRDGAIAALGLAKDAYEAGDHSLVGPMLKAALAFFENGH